MKFRAAFAVLLSSASLLFLTADPARAEAHFCEFGEGPFGTLYCTNVFGRSTTVDSAQMEHFGGFITPKDSNWNVCGAKGKYYGHTNLRGWQWFNQMGATQGCTNYYGQSPKYPINEVFVDQSWFSGYYTDDSMGGGTDWSYPVKVQILYTPEQSFWQKIFG